ncbi:glycosyl hydrolase family 53 [Colletotrichum graminicola]|uniref:Arabinogalactan endo-beta-1,4-galactanase n=1 Tax=Colletotrichum graminicola (strain M1.001 / M2 / FGSC 10212) TaxID=645133 RepID=E3QXW8_COLGM|nr:glycosyl hydrolase family 53 [Colletotrichum graminicola M1.001]EFQ35706.1 glycosyl hydrolase family 53 [Colletotrichum graminicola M1.001]WDK14805.1 glycosyl hydrolase family 53 [Colletotrichum graminicola]
MIARRILSLLSLTALAAAAPVTEGTISGPGDGTPFFYKGHDLSSLKLLEDSKNIFVDTARGNQERPADDILADGGMNAVRLRLWVDPPDGIYGLNYTISLAKRFQAKGQRVFLDFHFADSWADPQKQPAPAAWPTELGPLVGRLREYVRETLVAFKDAGVTLDIVSLGNEIRHGMLWPLGRVSVDVQPWPATVANFSNLATLYKAARAGVTDATCAGVPKPEVMLHLDNGWNLTLQERWYGALVDNGVPPSAWDGFGFSFYPFYGTEATFENLGAVLRAMADKYGKPMQVVETDYPAVCDGRWNPIPESSEPGIPYSVAGQVEWMAEVLRIVREAPRGLGRGVWYWEPAWLNNTSLGSACNDAILFEADYSGWPRTVGYSRESVNVFLD